METILITGHRKSGTTLLNKLFDNHKELNVYPTDISILYAFFPKFTYLFKNNTRKYNQRLKKIIYKTLKNSGNSFGSSSNSSKYAKIIYETIKKIPKKDRDNPEKLMTYLVTGFLKAKEAYNEPIKKATLLKETSILSYIPSLLNKKLKVVVLIRDPRDNYAAISAGVKKYYSKFGEDELSALASSINRMKFDLSLSSYYRKNRDKRFLFIKFEELVKNPKKMLIKVCRFIDIKFDDCLLRPSINSNEASGNNFDGHKFSGISRKNVGQYKKRLDSEQIKIIEWFLKKEMQEWGYLKKRFSLNRKYPKAIENFYKLYNTKYFFKDSFL